MRFTSGLEMTVPQEKFLVKMGGGVVAVRRQLPLRLAWAISVHKSQVWKSAACLSLHHSSHEYYNFSDFDGYFTKRDVTSSTMIR